jgi:signal transduction histidine kinase
MQLQTNLDYGSHPTKLSLNYAALNKSLYIEKDLKRIFQPFEQGDNSASRKYQGTGLGLSLTKKIIELHNGRLRAESEGIGQGSIFHFILPR